MNAGMFHFRVVWGMIPCDSTVVDVTDWSGSLTVTRGGLVVRRLIRFEPDQDQLLPRADRTLVEWVSATTIHNDGIACDVFVPHEIVELEDGNKVAFHGIQVFRQICPRGILAGHWGYDEEGNGVFRGLWFSGSGHVTGFLRGRYGQDDQGKNVFYGKWIDRDGRFEGLLRGTWGHHAISTEDEGTRNRPTGWFAGRIFDAERNPIGGLGGHYGSAPDFRAGWFQGRWKLNCDSRRETDNGYGVMNDGIPGGPMM